MLPPSMLMLSNDSKPMDPCRNRLLNSYFQYVMRRTRRSRRQENPEMKRHGGSTRDQSGMPRMQVIHRPSAEDPPGKPLRALFGARPDSGRDFDYLRPERQRLTRRNRLLRHRE